MAKVKEVTASVAIGGKIQVKKFDISADYEYAASKTFTLEPGDDPDEIIADALDQIKGQLVEPRGQADFEDLWEQRLHNEENKKLGDARR